MSQHILVRFILHVASSTFAVLLVFGGLSYLLRKVEDMKKWISSDTKHLLILCGLVVFATATQREFYDIYMGNNTFIKSIFDIVSWGVGCFGSVWVLYRFKMRKGGN